MSDQIRLLPEEMPKSKLLKSFPLSDLPDNEHLPGPKPSKAFIESVEQFGVVFPVALIKRGDVYDVVDGRRRVKAARALDHKQIAARVYEDDDLLFTGEALTIVLNRLRSDNPVAELTAIEAMVEQGASMSEIRKATGLPQATVEKRMRLQALKPELRVALEDGRIAVSVAESIVSLPDVSQDRLVEKLDESGKVTMPDVKEEKTVRAIDAMAQIPAGVFETPGEKWQILVAERLVEAAEMIPFEAELKQPIIGKSIKERLLGIAEELKEDAGVREDD